MLVAHMNRVKKHYNGRLVLDVDDFKVYEGDRIGIVGLNGSGKTTLLNILTNTVMPDEGVAMTYGSYAYITQRGKEEKDDIGDYAASRLGVARLSSKGLSGGEITRMKIAKALSKEPILLMADEPTSNLDGEGIEILKSEFGQFKGALLIVSHDREFLDQVCNSILEVENGKAKLYKGNYSQYKKLKQEERERALFEYGQYVTEKRRLQKAVVQKKNEVKTMRKVPTRMGNSEARLHKMGNQKSKAKLDRSIQALRTRIEKLEGKEKPKELPKVSVDIQKTQQLHCKVVLNSERLTKQFGEKVIFKDAKFKILNHSKTAIIGPNGAGKTTLVKMLVDSHSSVSKASGVKIGYFSQDISILEDDKTLLQNVLESSTYGETFVRILLARLYFRQEDLMKEAGNLSGGERVKAALAKIIVSDFNVLVLDEPTNYLDIYSIESVEEALLDYQGTVVFVSHDQRFVNRVADHVLAIENQKIICFDGSLEEYSNKKQKQIQPADKEAERVILQYRLTEVLSKLSTTSKQENIEALDQEYRQILKQLDQLKF